MRVEVFFNKKLVAEDGGWRIPRTRIMVWRKTLDNGVLMETNNASVASFKNVTAFAINIKHKSLDLVWSKSGYRAQYPFQHLLRIEVCN